MAERARDEGEIIRIICQRRWLWEMLGIQEEPSSAHHLRARDAGTPWPFGADSDLFCHPFGVTKKMTVIVEFIVLFESGPLTQRSASACRSD